MYHNGPILVIKRDGKKVIFKMSRIHDCINKAKMQSGEEFDVYEVGFLAYGYLCQKLTASPKATGVMYAHVEDISDATEKALKDRGLMKTYEEFSTYRKERTATRESKTALAKVIGAIAIETDRDNANVGNNFSAKLLRIGSEASKWYVTTSLLPKDEVKAHMDGAVYDQDLDSINLTINCLHIPTKRILDRGFNPGYGLIRKPNSIETAAMLSCILLQSSQNDMFGGQSHPNFDNDMSEYVMLSRKKETSRVLLHDYIESQGYREIVALIADITQEDVTNWTKEHYNRVEEVLNTNQQYTDYLYDYYNLNTNDTPHDQILAVMTTLIDALKSIKEFLKDIPSSDDIEFWDEMRTEWNKGKLQKMLNYTSAIKSGTELKSRVEPTVYRSVRQAMQTVVYNLNTMHSRAGAQVPFSTVNIGIPNNNDAAILCEVLLEEYAKGLGNGEQPIFPNIIFRVKDGVNKKPEDPYYYLFRKACKVAAKRMNPTFMNLDSNYYLPYYKKGIVGAIMGCRTAVCANRNGQEGPEGRGNIAPASINLPQIGLIAKQYQPDDEEKRIEYFWKLLNERLQLCERKLLTRYSILKKLKVKDIPFSIGQGLMLGNQDLSLDANDSIDPVLRQGTWAIGFIGIAETLICLIGEHQAQSERAQKLGLEIVKTIRKYADEASERNNLNFGCYATPAEGLCGKLVKIDRQRFGIVKGVTDKDYYTNSYHVPVSYSISIMDKMRIEAPYQYYCNSGCISYIEFDGEPTGETIERIVTKTFTELPDMNYMAGNFHKRTCKDCGQPIYDNITCKCPKCGSPNIQGVSRVTGYLSLDERFGVGKAAEKADRVPHHE